jgi:integrase/recombinase XerD
MNENPKSEIRQRAEEYLEWLAYTHKSPVTISVRRRYLGYFFNWCDDRSLENVDQFSRPVIERYQKHLYLYRKKNGLPLGISSQKNRLSTMRNFFKWLAQKRFILHNPAADIELPRTGISLPQSVFTLEEVESIMIQPDISLAEGIRDRAILEVFYSTAIRRAELAALNIYDYDNERSVLMIRQGKGRKDRVVPIGQRAELWLNKYLEDVREKFVIHSSSQTIFLSVNGTPVPLDCLTQNMRKYIKMAGVNKHGACHVFRHTAATLMLENGADIRYIQQMLGHSDLSTTEIYTRVSIKQLKTVHDLTHPSSKIQDSQKSDQQGAGPIQKSEKPPSKK